MEAVGARVPASGQMRGIRAGFLEEVVPDSHLEEGFIDRRRTERVYGAEETAWRQERDQQHPQSTLKKAVGGKVKNKRGFGLNSIDGESLKTCI